MVKYQSGQVTVFESALFRTTSTVIITDDLILVVDPTWLPHEIKEIQNFVFTNKGHLPLYLLFTHSDYDHIIGYNAFPGAQVIVSEAFENNAEKQKSLDGILQFDDEYYISRDYKIEFPKGDFLVKKDGQQLKVGNTILTFYLATGHNQDGIFTVVDPTNIWIAGDYLSNMEFPYIYFSSYDYEDTLNKVETILRNHEINFLIPGHGDIAFNHDEILKRKTENLNYIQELRNSLEAGKEFDLEHLWEHYKFPRIMKQFHEGNIKLMKKEIEGKKAGGNFGE